MNFINHDLIWWITAFELPALGGLFWLIWRAREEIKILELEVAKNYVSQKNMRELENRLSAHLLRIEAKLDATVLKAEALGAKT